MEELGAMGTNAVDDFDWLVQLRYYIEDFGFWELDGCWVIFGALFKILFWWGWEMGIGDVSVFFFCPVLIHTGIHCMMFCFLYCLILVCNLGIET